MSADYKPKIVKPVDSNVYCVFCYKKIPVGARYHYIKSRAMGTRPVCVRCAFELRLIPMEERP